MKQLEGRITKGVGGLYSVDTEKGVYSCNVRGIFRKHGISPTVGDYVSLAECDDTALKGTIAEIKERKNLLIRPKVANVDQAVVVMSIVYPSINLDVLDRLIVLIEEQGIDIVICLNKCDIAEEEKLAEVASLYTKVGYTVIPTSTKNETGINELMQSLHGKVSVFAGVSGVGKSSITNMVVPHAEMEVSGLCTKIERGKHTTRHAELLCIEKGTYIVDSPGFSDISLLHIEKDELKHLFREFNKDSLKPCRFLDCRHINEPDCSIKQLVGTEISPIRYERYVNIYNDLNKK